MLCCQHGYPLSSLATSPYHSSPLAGPQGYIPYPHSAAVCKFGLVVLLLPGHMWGSIEYVTYELVLASPAVSGVSGSSNLYSFRTQVPDQGQPKILTRCRLALREGERELGGGECFRSKRGIQHIWSCLWIRDVALKTYQRR